MSNNMINNLASRTAEIIELVESWLDEIEEKAASEEYANEEDAHLLLLSIYSSAAQTFLNKIQKAAVNMGGELFQIPIGSDKGPAN